MNNYQIINSVARSVEILKCLSSGASKITEVSTRLQINKAAVHRILKTLHLKDFVVQDPISRQYFLGPAIETLAASSIAVHQSLVEAAIGEMEALGRACGEAVVLQVIRGGQRVVLEKVAGTEMIRFYPENMEAASLHTGAGGHVLLAGLEDSQIAHVLARLSFEKRTPCTITDAHELKSRIEEVRRGGYAISRGESVKDAMAIAVPITSYACPAAIVIIGPENRMEKKKDKILNKVLKAGATISKRLTILPRNQQSDRQRKVS